MSAAGLPVHHSTILYCVIILTWINACIICALKYNNNDNNNNILLYNMKYSKKEDSIINREICMSAKFYSFFYISDYTCQVQYEIHLFSDFKRLWLRVYSKGSPVGWHFMHSSLSH